MSDPVTGSKRHAAAFLAFAAFATAALVVSGFDSEPELPAEPLPVLGTVADFTLVDQEGVPLNLKRLAGRIWVVDFIFTRCPSICPQMTNRMKAVAFEWRKESDLRFLSISVDPEHDRPQVLKDYASKAEIPLRRWLLATGEPEAVRALCRDSFKLALGEAMGPDGDITHSSRFILVDRVGRIRGYYNTQFLEDLDKLDGDLRRLLKEGPQPEGEG